ncbi:MAG TPA: tetratricopeptide repeat protein [Candidatus Saccharimonadales bacterium]|nr:tetratricopeptide repeat protein [Candidatus Saccharimonadales bacterium]
MKQRPIPLPVCVLVFAAALCAVPALVAQSGTGRSPETAPAGASAAQAEMELQTGIELTRKRLFTEAIPHFLAAQGRVRDDYAARFNLALCYVGISEHLKAIEVLDVLRAGGRDDANVENLLAQAYIGSGKSEEAFRALLRAAALTPDNEKLYVFVGDACLEQGNYTLGLRVADVGLRHLPGSARLHYDRAYSLTLLDQFDLAKAEYDTARDLAPHGEVGFLAATQKNVFAGNLPEAIRVARTAVREGRANYLLQALLGDALLRAGASPGQPEFSEAEAALKSAVAAGSGFAAAHVTLGYLYLLDGQPERALGYLEKGRELGPQDPSVYSHLAVAYRKLGKPQEAREALATLARLNARQVAQIHSSNGERKAIPGGRTTPP